MQQTVINKCLVDARNRFEIYNFHGGDRLSKFDEDNFSVLVVESMENFCHQVAGHTNEILRRYKTMILKPMVKKDLFMRELSIYEYVASRDTMTYKGLSASDFFPRYFGAVVARIETAECLPFICLENLTLNYDHPCVMDIKMGRQTFEPTASNDKKQREKLKYQYQEEIGFRITGFKVLDVIDSTYKSVDKRFGRSLTPDNVHIGLASFFFNGRRLRRDVISALLTRLYLLFDWMREQTRFHFICSSLLVIYEGIETNPDTHTDTTTTSTTTPPPCAASGLSRDVCGCTGNDDPVGMCGEGVEASPPPAHPLGEGMDSLLNDNLTATATDPGPVDGHGVRIQMRIIDLAHTVDSPDGLPDVGYIHGLERLIASLQNLLEDKSDMTTLASIIHDLLLPF